MNILGSHAAFAMPGSSEDGDPALMPGLEVPFEFDASLTTILQDSRRQLAVVAFNATNMADFAKTRERTPVTGNHAFFALLQALRKNKMEHLIIESEGYETANRSTHLGIEVARIPELVASIDTYFPVTKRIRTPDRSHRRFFLEFSGTVVVSPPLPEVN